MILNISFLDLYPEGRKFKTNLKLRRKFLQLLIFYFQFSVPGSGIILSPELYITVLAYTSILNPEAPQVKFTNIFLI